jgi:hypothetical protein
MSINASCVANPIIGKGQKNQAFWERIATHYNNSQPLCCAKRPTRSLETKWRVIKHNVTKFCCNYQVVVALNKSDESFEEYIIINFRAFQSKKSKTRNWVTFIHCWLILEDIPRWAETKEESKIWPTPTKKKDPIESMNLVRAWKKL